MINMSRQIVLDTETTGISVAEGHRIIEIGCVELLNRKLSGKHLQFYINPEREVEAGALAVHGITNEFLSNKPVFASIVSEFMEFIDGAELIIHNAPFDLSFLNNELMLTRSNWKAITHHCRVVDTLPIARQLHAGQRNSLDALCKRYGVDNSKRDLHGALLDAHLLAHIYLAMTGGQGSFFDSITESQREEVKNAESTLASFTAQYVIPVLKASAEELEEHKKYLQLLQGTGKCLWQE